MKRLFISFVATLLMLPLAASAADTAAELDAKVDRAIADFKAEVNGAEGALRVAGRSAAYYRTTSGSFGFQLGAQAKSIVIAFMTKEALAQFRNSSGWQVGIDGSVALIDLGAGKQINNSNIKDPVVGFIFGAKGLMYNLTLEGTKISRVQKDQ